MLLWVGEIDDFVSVFLHDGTILQKSNDGQIFVLKYDWQPPTNVAEFRLQFIHNGKVIECKYNKLLETPDWVQDYFNSINNLK